VSIRGYAGFRVLCRKMRAVRIRAECREIAAADRPSRWIPTPLGRRASAASFAPGAPRRDQARLALACAGAGEHDRATAEGRKALAIARKTKSSLAARELKRLGQTLGAAKA
jgi:hypothetical protein